MKRDARSLLRWDLARGFGTSAAYRCLPRRTEAALALAAIVTTSPCQMPAIQLFNESNLSKTMVLHDDFWKMSAETVAEPAGPGKWLRTDAGQEPD
jgi:hypothetical protein